MKRPTFADFPLLQEQLIAAGQKAMLAHKFGLDAERKAAHAEIDAITEQYALFGVCHKPSYERAPASSH